MSKKTQQKVRHVAHRTARDLYRSYFWNSLHQSQTSSSPRAAQQPAHVEEVDENAPPDTWSFLVPVSPPEVVLKSKRQFTPDCLTGALCDGQCELTLDGSCQPLFKSVGFEEHHGGVFPFKKNFTAWFCTIFLYSWLTTKLTQPSSSPMLKRRHKNLQHRLSQAAPACLRWLKAPQSNADPTPSHAAQNNFLGCFCLLFQPKTDQIVLK